MQNCTPGTLCEVPLSWPAAGSFLFLESVSRLAQEARHSTHHADSHNSKELLSGLTASFWGTCMGAGASF
eukprot:12658908-Prorocentrum_lima.AAC.1